MTTRQLTAADLDLSRQFLHAHARPLEQAQFAHRYDGGTADAVIDALAAFQNPDGGFGRALEPDVRSDVSSALCTSIALRTIRATGDASSAPTCAPLVEGAIRYLVETLRAPGNDWRIIPPAADQSPHAPWWTQAGREAGFEGYTLNPAAEIVGTLYDHSALVPGDLLTATTEAAFAHLGGLEKIEMHDLLCCLRLLDTPALPDALRETVRERLAALVGDTIEQDPDTWAGYCLRPLQVVTGPTSPFLPGLESAVAANLDYEITSRHADGSWKPTWDWGDAHPEVWAQAAQEWAGCLTLNTLSVLQAFGRLDR